jgi:hypothetical protein
MSESFLWTKLAAPCPVGVLLDILGRLLRHLKFNYSPLISGLFKQKYPRIRNWLKLIADQNVFDFNF